MGSYSVESEINSFGISNRIAMHEEFKKNAPTENFISSADFHLASEYKMLGNEELFNFHRDAYCERNWSESTKHLESVGTPKNNLFLIPDVISETSENIYQLKFINQQTNFTVEQI
ncbi:MAG: hypothetical protein ACRC37_01300 [Lentisphaeria bacterium]